MIADGLNLSIAEVHGVVTFYRDFRRSAGRPHDRAGLPRRGVPGRGRRGAGRAREGELGVGFGETTADGRGDLDEVFCLGNCALGPAVRWTAGCTAG